jgi:hypothetical protein
VYVSIGHHPKGAEDGPRLLLEGCHGRIRSFTSLALRLAQSASAAPVEQIGDAAGQVCRYFGEALPLHVADEELSLAPRLQPLASSALAEMASQHRAIEAVLERLLALWRELAGRPEELPALAAALCPPTSALAALWEPHLALEERVIFPALDRLAPLAKAEIWREMRARRARPTSMPRAHP